MKPHDKSLGAASLLFILCIFVAGFAAGYICKRDSTPKPVDVSSVNPVKPADSESFSVTKESTIVSLNKMRKVCQQWADEVDRLQGEYNKQKRTRDIRVNQEGASPDATDVKKLEGIMAGISNDMDAVKVNLKKATNVTKELEECLDRFSSGGYSPELAVKTEDTVVVAKTLIKLSGMDNGSAIPDSVYTELDKK